MGYMKLNPRWFFQWVPVCLGLSLLAACESRNKRGEPHALVESYNRSPAEFRDMMRRAEAGDSGACEQIGHYHAFALQDHEEAIRWLKKACELSPGDERLKHNLAVMLDANDED